MANTLDWVIPKNTAYIKYTFYIIGNAYFIKIIKFNNTLW